MENTPNPKCTRCKCYWKLDETDIKSSGLVCKTCKKCRENGKKNNKKYYQDNIDKVKEKHKKYYEENADEIKEQKKKYYEENTDKVKEYKKNIVKKINAFMIRGMDIVKYATNIYI